MEFWITRLLGVRHNTASNNPLHGPRRPKLTKSIELGFDALAQFFVSRPNLLLTNLVPSVYYTSAPTCTILRRGVVSSNEGTCKTNKGSSLTKISHKGHSKANFLTVASEEPVKMKPSVSEIEVTANSCPVTVNLHSPVSTSQHLAVPSAEPVKR